MDNKELIDLLNISKSISDALKKIGFPDNANYRKKIKIIAKELNFDLETYKQRKEIFCKRCGTKLKKGQFKFCSSSCAASYNNTGRIHTNETKKKISEKMKVICPNGPIVKYNVDTTKPRKKRKTTKKISINTCYVCGKEFIVFGSKEKQRKTCSPECRSKITTSRKYQNGSRKTIYYISKLCGEVVLESTWELIFARFLDGCNVKWVRPKPLFWFDSVNKKHLFYPDFYLNDYNIYVDPKNKYCISKDVEKIEYFNDKINLIYGEIHEVINKVNIIINGDGTKIDEQIYNIDDYLKNIANNDINTTLKTNFCNICGKKLTFIGKSGLCRDCFNLKNSKKPSKDDLVLVMKNNTMNSASKIYNVTHHTFKNWLISYSLINGE